MSNEEITKVPLEALNEEIEKRRGEERMMTSNDELVHLEVQGVIREQQLQMEIVARVRNIVQRIEDRLTDVEIDRDELSIEVTHLRAECEQMHVRQNATDSRLEVIAAVFASGMQNIRETNEAIERTNKTIEETNRVITKTNETVGHLAKSVADTTED